jgi:hypothetical protein
VYPRVTEKDFKDNNISSIRLVSLTARAAEGRRSAWAASPAQGEGEGGGDAMAPEAETSRSEAEAAGASMTALLDRFRTDILGVLDELKRAADHLLDHILAEQVPWARETVERLAPLVDESLAQGQAAAGAVLGQAKQVMPQIAAVQQHPWVILGSALLVTYFVAGGDSRAPTPPPVQPRPPQTPSASD